MKNLSTTISNACAYIALKHGLFNPLSYAVGGTIGFMFAKVLGL